MTANVKPHIKDSKNKKIPKKFLPRISTNVEKGFVCFQKLEVFLDNGEFHSGTIIEIKDHLLIIQLDNDDSRKQELFLAPADSLDIFPLGWSHTNNLPIMLPSSYVGDTKLTETHSLNPSAATHFLLSQVRSVISCIRNGINEVIWVPRID